MKVTKLEHSGIVLEKAGHKLIFDPVEFDAKLPELSAVAAVIITHKHFDHFQKEQIEKILASNPEAKVIGPSDLAAELPQLIVAKAGDELELDGFQLQFFGRDHSLVFGGVMPCENLGVVVDDRVVNAGDSFDRPKIEHEVDLLFVPEAAPWWNVDECTKFISDLHPKYATPVHDALLSPLGQQVFGGGLKATCEKNHVQWLDLGVGESVEI